MLWIMGMRQLSWIAIRNCDLRHDRLYTQETEERKKEKRKTQAWKLITLRTSLSFSIVTLVCLFVY